MMPTRLHVFGDINPSYEMILSKKVVHQSKRIRQNNRAHSLNLI